jgi:hypothetical protein
VVRRRSARLEELRPISQPETTHDDLSDEDRVTALPETLADVPVVDLDYTPTTDRAITTQVNIHLAAFHEQWLGKQLTPLGKSPVLLAMINAGATPDMKLTAVCGQQRCVQEFGNALAVFVDLKHGENRANVFQATGDGDQRVVFFRWFAWDSWKRQRPVVERLQRVSLGDKRFLLNDAVSTHQQPGRPLEQLLLFVQNSEKDPYVYCGRLAFLGMRTKQPLEFRWQLLDAHALSWMTASPSE